MMTRRKPLPNGSRAIMGSAKKRRGKDLRQNFPTPPWATRALFESVMPHIFHGSRWIKGRVCWEPACGQRTMSEVLTEYFREVWATDKYDYGSSCLIDFLDAEMVDYYVTNACRLPSWIVTNPPFGKLTLPFVHRAVDLATVGVAMFVRSQWLEGVTRYNELFSKNPPTLIAQFAERVPLCKGRWDPDGTTATAYCWLVWVKGREPMAPFWIPPGQRKRLERADDRARYAAWSLPQKEAAE